jgi:hypothetical protein
MRRLNRVQVDVEGTIVELDWQLGLELRERFKKADRRDLADRLAGVGASRPVRLSRAEAGVLRALLDDWGTQISAVQDALAHL